MTKGRNTEELTKFYKGSAKALKKLTYLPFTATYKCMGGNQKSDIPVGSMLGAAATCVLSPVLLALSVGTTALAAGLALLLAISALVTYPITMAKDSFSDDYSKLSSL